MTDLPKRWQRRPLSDVATVILGQSPPGSSYNSEGLGDAFFQGKTEFGELHPTVRKWTTAGTKFAEPGDVLVSVRAPVGPTNVATIPCAIGRGLAALRAGHELDPSYLLHVMRGTEEALAAKATGTTFEAVSGAVLRGHLIPVPPLDEQRRIVNVLEDHLSGLDAGMKGLDAALILSAQLLAAMRQEAVGLATVDTPLAEVASIQGGIQKQPKRRPQSNVAPFLRVANVTPLGLDLDDVHEIELFAGELDRYRLEAGDLLVVEGNGSPSQIGRAALWDGKIADCVHQNHLIRVRPSSRLHPKFLEIMWNAPSTRKRLTAVSSSTSGLHTPSVAKLKAMPICVPDLDEQVRFVRAFEAEVARMDRLMAAVSTQRTRGVALRRSVLSAAFAGRISEGVPEVSDV